MRARTRAAIYARYSTDKQDARSIEDQIRRARAKAAERGLEVVAEYTDAAISGATTDRLNLQRLLKDAKRDDFDTVLVDDLSRLSRDMGDTWRIIFTDLAAEGVNVFDCTAGIASDARGSRLTFGALALVNDTFRELIREETRRGLEGRALAGFATGGRTYGFKTVPEPNPPDPNKVRKVRVIHPDEAVVVRRIFELAAEGVPVKRIAATLNDEAIPAPHDGGKGNKVSKGWGHTTVRHMLRNENYVGRFTYNRHQFMQIPGKANSHRHVPKPEAEHIKKEFPELAIVSLDVWAKVQELHVKKSHAPRSGTGTKDGTLLSGLVKCGVCGGSMVVASRRYGDEGEVWTNYGCGVRRSGGVGRCSNSRTVSARKLTEAFTSALRDTLMKEGMVERFIAGVKKRYERPKSSPLVDLEKRVTVAETRVRNATDALVKMGFSAAMAEAVKRVEENLAKLRSELTAATKAHQPRVLPHPKVIETFLGNMLQMLETDMARGKALLKQFMPPVIVTPQEDGTFKLTGGFDLEAVLDSRDSNSRRDRD